MVAFAQYTCHLRGRFSHAFGRSASNDVQKSEKSQLAQDDHQKSRHPMYQRLHQMSRTRVLCIAGIGLLILLLQAVHLPIRTRSDIHRTHDAHLQLRYMQLLIPAERMHDVDLCKTILTAQVLNYPVPVVIPWGRSANGSPVPKRARMQSKVASIHKYLQSLPAELDDAITILLDGPDTWFQLRPDQLLQQYFQVTANANKRLRQKYGQHEHVEQKLLFAAQNNCASKNAGDLACTVVPEVPQEAGVDGAGPRYLGNGAVMGQTKHLRALLKRAYAMVQKDPPTKLITTYSEIFGQQESQRDALRSSHQVTPGSTSRFGLLKNRLGLAKRNSAVAPVHNLVLPSPTKRNETYELGIGLDYGNAIGFSASQGTDQAEWQKQHPLTNDMIATSVPPFWTVSDRESNIPRSATWSQVALLAAKRTNTIPAMIHHIPTALNGADSSHLRRDWWPKMWLQPYARALYTNAEQLPATAVAAVTREDGQQELYWNRHTWTEKAGAWLPGDTFSYWHDMCGADEQWQEVFRDKEGPWRGL